MGRKRMPATRVKGVRLPAYSLDACVSATLAHAGCGLQASRPPAKAEGGDWECVLEAPNDDEEG